MQDFNDPLLSVISARLVLPVLQFCHIPCQERALAECYLKQCYLLILKQSHIFQYWFKAL